VRFLLIKPATPPGNAHSVSIHGEVDTAVSGMYVFKKTILQLSLILKKKS
jgi:hypothetical protein